MPTPFRRHHQPISPFPAKSVMDNVVSDKGYTYFPAGFIATSAFRFVALVKRVPLRRDHFNAKTHRTTGDNIWDVRFQLPDRDVRLLPFSEPFNPDEYDEIHYIDPFDPRSRICDDIEWVLGSAHYAMEKLTFPWGQPADIKVVMDSGGAQIKLGTADYVNPKDVIDVMNKTAHAGFALDVPPKINVDLRDRTMLDTLAFLQKKNNRIFLAERRDDLALLNVLHGVTMDEQRRWFDKVYDDGFQGYALGIDDGQDPLSGVRGAIMLHEKLKGQDFWLHVFGVSGAKMIPALAWFGRIHGRISSDSSSWYEGSRRGKYLIHDRFGKMHNARLSAQMIDRKDEFYMMRQKSGVDDLTWSPGGLLPCGCQICQIMGNVDSMFDHYYDSAFMSLHDLLVMRKFGHQWNTLAQTLPLNEYVALTRQIMGPRSADMVEYIDIGLEHGLETAEKYFRGGPNKTHTTRVNGLVANATAGRKMSLFTAGKKGGQKDEGLEESAEVAAQPTGDEELDEMRAEVQEELEDSAALAEGGGLDVDAEAAGDDEDDGVVVQTSGLIGGRIRIKASEVEEDPSFKNLGFCPTLQIYTTDTVPKDIPEPRLGWPLTQEVAKFSAFSWAPTQTTVYQTNWRKDKPIRVCYPPKFPEGMDVPTNPGMAFEKGSNMECILNYVDINNPADVDVLNEIDPGIMQWIYYMLYHNPDTFRMKELAEVEGFKQVRNRVDKERIIHEFYQTVRKAQDEGRWSDIPHVMVNEHIKKKPATQQRQKIANKARRGGEEEAA